MPRNNNDNQYFRMEIKGTARDAHSSFPIKFDYGQSGVAYFTGCKAEAKLIRGDKTITNRIDVQAFGDIAEELASVVDGTEIHLFGEWGQKKSLKDEKYYPVFTVDEVVSIG